MLGVDCEVCWKPRGVTALQSHKCLAGLPRLTVFACGLATGYHRPNSAIRVRFGLSATQCPVLSYERLACDCGDGRWAMCNAEPLRGWESRAEICDEPVPS